jgi:hypothetical protein
MRVVLLLVGLALGGCATTYQPQGFSGGFTETQLDTNVFRISFKGNGFTNVDRAEELALLRCAEVVLQHGFTHFVITDGRTRMNQSSFTTPVQATTTGTVSTFGNTAHGSATTTMTGGQTVVTNKPSSTNTIVAFKGRPDTGGMVYDAQFLYDSLSKKYDIKR